MKVSAQEIEQRQVVLEVEVEDERVERALDEAYKRIVNRINVPGFRRGRAPRPLVERMVGREAILEDAVEHLVPRAYQDALKEQNITPSGQPSLEITSTEPLQFKATVPLEPQVELCDYRLIHVELEPVTVEDSEVDAVVQSLRESNATWVPVERPVRIGDRVGLDVRGTRDGRTILDNHDAEFIVNPDGPEPMPGFSPQLVGMEAGQERTFSLGGQSGQEEGEATPTEFVVKLQWVKEKELPELDEEFARTVGDKESVEDLRREIREQIARRKEQAARERQREEILKQAVEQATVVAPPQAIERQAQQLLDTMAATLDKQGISVEQYLQFTGKDESQFRAELLADGEQSLRRNLVLGAIAEAEGLEISEAEVRAEIELAAKGAGDPARTAQQAFARPEARARIESILKTRKAVEWLVEHAGGASEQAATDEVSETNGETDV